MQKLALDTNAYTALGYKNKTVATYIETANTIGVPIVVLAEIRFGALNGTQYAKNIDLLDALLLNNRVEVLDIDDQTTRLFAEIATTLRSMGRPIQQNDVWIAALCKQYGYKLVTNDQGFDNILGLDILKF